MILSITIVGLLAISTIAYFSGWKKAIGLTPNKNMWFKMHSRPSYYGTLTALVSLIPCLIVMMVWLSVEPHYLQKKVKSELATHLSATSSLDMVDILFNETMNVVNGDLDLAKAEPAAQEAAHVYQKLKNQSQFALSGILLSLALLFYAWSYRKISTDLKARIWVERIIKGSLIICSSIAILTTVGIIFSVLFEAVLFFREVSFWEFITGIKWSPQMSIRSDQVGSSGAFGAIPVFAGTLMITGIAMIVSIPVGLMSAIYLSEYASNKVRSIAKPLIEILAGIPTVVYGFFAALTVAPFIRDTAQIVGLKASSESALAAGAVMGIMIIPFVSSLSDDVISAVPQSLRDGSYGLGATRSETIKKVLIPAALPGIVGGFLLAVSRAIGETMIVVMAVGLAANLTANPLDTVTTVTVQIVTLLVGDQEFDSPKTLAAFALGLVLFTVTLCLNIIALKIVQRYREQYE